MGNFSVGSDFSVESDFCRSSFTLDMFSLIVYYAEIITYFLWAVNSVGECHLHTVEVTGSNPVPPTRMMEFKGTSDGSLFFFFTVVMRKLYGLFALLRSLGYDIDSVYGRSQGQL